jgi:hypothetical protein
MPMVLTQKTNMGIQASSPEGMKKTICSFFPSFRRKSEFGYFKEFWTPAFAGVTLFGLFMSLSKLIYYTQDWELVSMFSAWRETKTHFGKRRESGEMPGNMSRGGRRELSKYGMSNCGMRIEKGNSQIRNGKDDGFCRDSRVSRY